MNEHTIGECPRCGSHGLSYETPGHWHAGEYVYPYRCEKCGANGLERYSLTFEGYSVVESNDLPHDAAREWDMIESDTERDAEQDDSYRG